MVTAPQFLVLGQDRFTADLITALQPQQITSEAALAECSENGTRGARWIAFRPSLLRCFAHTHPQRKLGNVLVLPHVSYAVLALLESRFSRVALASRDDVRRALLPADQMAEALGAPNKSDLFLGGHIDTGADIVALIRGDLRTLVVPLRSFEPSGDGKKPDFDDFSITDYGQAVCFGDYESSNEAILYENDPEFRRKLKKQHREQDDSFGACLRRLRLQKGVSQDDFHGVSGKTLARLERNEVARPQKRTLKTIADRLGVGLGEITEY